MESCIKFSINPLPYFGLDVLATRSCVGSLERDGTISHLIPSNPVKSYHELLCTVSSVIYSIQLLKAAM